eukprot:TRINITY_DN3205_c4_g1_i1.p1 TRINITY_DN3205_c4_g1~~TRINITY_DN3205_c4_g1_i1.p1  ORF type:complete len:447 (+),score=56.24 TRINITY_DN3205_c4_g1_i1:53-1342(+)
MSVKTLLVLALAGSTFAAYPTKEGLEALFEKVLDEVVPKYNCSFAIAFKSENLTAEAASGDKTGTGVPATPDDKWVWGSVTKMSTGTSILQLVQQGKLSLDEPVHSHLDQWFARTKPANYSSCQDLWGPESSKVTIQNLLSMRSGIPDFDTAKGSGKHMTDSFRADVYAHPTEMYTPEDLLNVPWVHTGSLVFTPGTKQAYSSTNFMLLGMILAEIYGAQTWTEFNQKVLFPQNILPEFVNTSYADGAGGPAKYTSVHGFDRTNYNNQSGLGQGISVYNVAGVFSGWTASNIVAPVRDISNLVYSIYGPQYRLLSKKYVDMMIPTDPFYGMATFNLSFDTGLYAAKHGYGSAYGHLGATYGYQSIAVYFPKLQFTLAIASDIETDVQAQPAETYCLAYNGILGMITDTDIKCHFQVVGYYGGLCNCTAQ